jgi:glucan phosphoethanolaminetransferase (alkaline phosphatase superfamily)
VMCMADVLCVLFAFLAAFCTMTELQLHTKHSLSFLSGRRIAAIVCSTIAGVHGVFIADYAIPNHNNPNEEPHVFSFLQNYVKSQTNAWMLRQNYNDNNVGSNANGNTDGKNPQDHTEDSS